MKKYILAALIVGLCVFQAFCQENKPSGVEEAKTQAIKVYGEIGSINAAAGSMVVDYYDYDSDNEKTVEVTTDANTKIEGGLTIKDIKAGDWVDISYMVEDGKNAAKSIAVEKEDVAVPNTPTS